MFCSVLFTVPLVLVISDAKLCFAIFDKKFFYHMKIKFWSHAEIFDRMILWYYKITTKIFQLQIFSLFQNWTLYTRLILLLCSRGQLLRIEDKKMRRTKTWDIHNIWVPRWGNVYIIPSISLWEGKKSMG